MPPSKAASVLKFAFLSWRPESENTFLTKPYFIYLENLRQVFSRYVSGSFDAILKDVITSMTEKKKFQIRHKSLVSFFFFPTAINL